MSEIISLKRNILAKFWGFQSMTVFLLLWVYRIDRPTDWKSTMRKWVGLHNLLQWHLFYDMRLSRVTSYSNNIQTNSWLCVCVSGGRIQHLNHSRDLGWLWHPMRFFLGKCELFTSDGSLMADQRNNPTWVFLPEPMNLLGSLIRY